MQTERILHETKVFANLSFVFKWCRKDLSSNWMAGVTMQGLLGDTKKTEWFRKNKLFKLQMKTDKKR